MAEYGSNGHDAILGTRGSAVQNEVEMADYHCVSADDDQLSADDGQANARNSERCSRYRRYAVYLCSVSLVVTLSLGTVGFVESVRTDNDAAFGFALNCVLDFFSTLVVLWRFWPQTFQSGRYGRAVARTFDNPADLLAGRRARSQKREWWLRERRATIGIAILFVLAFVAVVCKALADIINSQVPSSGLPTVILAAVSAAVFLLLAYLKVHVAGVLQSPAMRSDGINSLAGAVISVGVLISWLVTRSHPHVWYVDAFVALLVGLGMFLYAIRMLMLMMSRDNRTAPVY